MFGKWSCNLIFFPRDKPVFRLLYSQKKPSSTKGNCKWGNFEFLLNVPKRFLPFTLLYCIEQVYLYRSIWTDMLYCVHFNFKKKHASTLSTDPYTRNTRINIIKTSICCRILKPILFFLIKNCFLKKVWLEKYGY